MLRGVLGVFLEKASERDFDLPFLALLRARGFTDVHFTHGTAEFGKDFIAKREEGGRLVQYSFQSKAGNIGQGAWRSEIMPQMQEAIVIPLSHPSFDASLPHQAVLVLTGRLTGNAPVSAQQFSKKMAKMYGALPMATWDREVLLDYLVEMAPDELYGSALTASYLGYGDFFGCYGKALDHRLDRKEIERHSRYWETASPDDQTVLRATLEGEVLATALVSDERMYEALHAHLTVHRFYLAAHFLTEGEQERARFAADLTVSRSAVLRVAQAAMARLADALKESGGRLFDALHPTDRSPMQYLVACSRALEVAVVVAALGGASEAEAAADFLAAFLTDEPGATHPASDVHVVSLLWGLLVVSRRDPNAAQLAVERATVWLCDRYEKAGCLAAVDASPDDETHTLLGAAFDFTKPASRRQSFLATALVDAAAFIDETLYVDVLNDVLAVDIAPQYWQAADTVGQFRVDAPDVAQYVNVQYAEPRGDVGGFAWAEHVREEAEDLSVGRLDPCDAVLVSLLLRDRYFPKLWPKVLGGSETVANVEVDHG